MRKIPFPGLRAVQPRGPDRRVSNRLGPPYPRAAGWWWCEQRWNSVRREQDKGRQRAGAITQDDSLFRSAFEDACDAMAVVDGQGTLIVVNRQCERLFAHRREALVGKSMARLFPESQRRTVLRLCEAAGGRSQSPSRLTLQGARADGSEFPLELSLSRLPGTRHVLALATLRDITGYFQALKALQQQNSTLAAANGQLRADIELHKRAEAELRQLNAAIARDGGS